MHIILKEFWLKPIPDFFINPRPKGRDYFSHTNRYGTKESYSFK